MRFSALAVAVVFLLFSPAAIAKKTALPLFRFTAVGGKTYNSDDFRGKIVILNFWASWCPPCIQEFPSLIAVAAKNPQDVVLIALSSDIDQKAVEDFLTKMEKSGLQWEHANVLIAVDPEDVTQKIFGIRALPETVIVNKRGDMEGKFSGAGWTVESMQKTINSFN